MRAFHKENLRNPIKHNGNAVPWEAVERNSGVRNLDESRDATLIALLDTEADKRRNGVRRISAEQYDGLKKNTSLAKSTPHYDNVMPSIRLNDPESVVPKLRSPAQSVVAPPASPTASPAPQQTPAPAAPSPVEVGKLESSETPARAKAKRGKLADLKAKEQAIAEQ